MPRFSWINSLQVFLLLSSSLFLLYGSTGWASPVPRGEPTVAEQFQISDVVFREKVLPIDEVRHLESATGSPDEIVKQRESDTQEAKSTCAPGRPNALDRFFLSLPLTDDEPTWSDTLEVEFKVSKAWKGTNHNKMALLVACHLESCVYPFNVGDTYLVFACSERVRDVEKVSVNECLWTDFYSDNHKLDNSLQTKTVIKQLDALMSDLFEDKVDGGGS